METKICRKCGIEKPLTKDYFHWDSRKYQNGEIRGFCARCKDCKNEQKNIKAKQDRAELKLIYGTSYIKSNYIKYRESRLEYEKKPEVKVKKNERAKRNRKLNNNSAIYARELNKKNNKKHCNEITDYYVKRLICRHSTVLKKEDINNSMLIDAWRNNLKIKRLCR